MSGLRVLWPEDAVMDDGATDLDQPAILPFRTERSQRDWRFDVVARAQALYENRTCPSCDYAVVEPIELGDAVRNRNGLPIPGTATLVGFRCRGCRCEWSV
ncbi:MAG: hypothetical protein SH850_03955 [Planctomycetaceae bacterium]|nr:hypothetical protein [Planctomycetaceae bacterium]